MHCTPGIPTRGGRRASIPSNWSCIAAPAGPSSSSSFVQLSIADITRDRELHARLARPAMDALYQDWRTEVLGLFQVEV